MKPGVLILGATSTIAEASAGLWAAEGRPLALVARDTTKLDRIAANLTARHDVPVHTHICGLADASTHPALLEWSGQLPFELDSVLLAYGVLSEPAALEESGDAVAALFASNLVSPIQLLDALLSRHKTGKAMHIGVITSVAGDRGRASIGHYGASKAGLSTYLSALQQKHHASGGVRITDIKPGRIQTPMTAHLPPSLLTACPDHCARDTVRAMKQGRRMIYTPWFWRWIMLIIRLLPAPLFRRMKF